MNETIALLQSHRSIRQFTDEPISEADLAAILNCGMRTSTSRGLQHASLIHITDQHIKDELSQIGNQPYIAAAPGLIVALVDARRSVLIRSEFGADTQTAVSVDVFREGLTDAVLMVQNMTIAAESLGLGVTQLGSVLNDYARIISLLGLPRYTFPALGMMFGHPDAQPQIKPRIPTGLRVMENTYSEPASWTEALAEYDAAMMAYYGGRESNRRTDTYTHQVSRFVGRPDRERFVHHAMAQGFAMLVEGESLGLDGD